ncbi:MAG: hypothetical protein HUU55_20245 [Myxococcales bacterium]|nr:hypothetical protein [Myxococcales bacterium]
MVRTEGRWPDQPAIERQSVLEIEHQETDPPEQLTYRLRGVCLGPVSVVQIETSRFGVTASTNEMRVSRKSLLDLWERARQWVRGGTAGSTDPDAVVVNVTCCFIVGGRPLARYGGSTGRATGAGSPANHVTVGPGDATLNGVPAEPRVMTSDVWLEWAAKLLEMAPMRTVLPAAGGGAGNDAGVDGR